LPWYLYVHNKVLDPLCSLPTDPIPPHLHLASPFPEPASFYYPPLDTPAPTAATMPTLLNPASAPLTWTCTLIPSVVTSEEVVTFVWDTSIP
jgi:hypothetical protein